jgi:hypothetical protein
MTTQALLPLAGLLAWTLAGCSTAISLTTPLEPERHPPFLAQGPIPVVVVPPPAGVPVGDHLARYLEASPHWQRRSPDSPSAPGSYRIEWNVAAENFTGDLGTKRSVVIYFYCTIFVIAPFVANFSRWHATHFYEVEMCLRDPSGRMVYQHKKGLAINEHDTTLPATAALKEAMQELNAKNITTLMMNRLEQFLAGTAVPQPSWPPKEEQASSP